MARPVGIADGQTRRWAVFGTVNRYMSIAMAAVIMTACASPTPPELLVAHRCMAVSGVGHATMTVASPATGTLLFTVEERGISVNAALDATREGSSPVDRLGLIVLTAATRAGQSHTLHIQAEDPQDLPGQVCAAAQIIGPDEKERLLGEQAFARAGAAVRTGNWELAFAQYLAAARGYDGLRLTSRAARSRQAMAELAYLRFDRKRDSYALASAALQDYDRHTDPAYLGALATLQAKALMDMPGAQPASIAPEVREHLQAARRLDRSSEFGTRELPRVDILTGFLDYGLDAPDRAALIFAAAAQRCREMNDWDCYGIATQNLGALAEESNNYSSALAVYGDALRFLNPDLHQKLVADIRNNLGRVQGVVGMFSSSEQSHAAAMHGYALLGDCPGVRRSLARSGNLLVQVGTISDAEHDLQEALTLPCPALLAGSRTASRSAPEAPSQNVRPPGNDSALPTARENLCRDPLDPANLADDNRMIVFDALLSLSDALVLEGEPAYAQHCLEAAQPYAATSRAQMRLANARGTALLEHDDAAAARSSFEQALLIADAAKIPAANEHRGSAQLGVVKATLMGGRPTEALPAAFQALQSSVARGDIEQTVVSLRLIATALRDSGRTPEAAHTLQVAVSLTESVPIDELDGEKRATYLATQHAVFSELMDLLASQSSPDATAWRAFETSERGRARSLRFAVSQSAQDAASPNDAPPAARYRQLLRDVVRLTAINTSGVQQPLIDALADAAGRQSSDAETVDRELLAQTLGRLDATLVEYAVGSRNMFAFVVSASGIQVVRLADHAEISDAAAQLRERIRDDETPAADVRAAAQRLARLVIWPLRDHLTGQRIIFVPDDALHTIPFAVLPWTADSDSQLVLQHVQTSIAPSALFLTNLRAAQQPPNDAPRITLIGDPVFRISDWRSRCAEEAVIQAAAGKQDRALSDWAESLPRLPGTRAEVLMIAKLAMQARPASRVDTRLGCAADANALRSPTAADADLLHIATHARVDAQRPRLSALALSPDRNASPMTSAFGLLDILGLKLHSRLVVLSACDTSRGKLLPGEGVLGPAQAFLEAGSAAVLASYWRVDDQATAGFMARFYNFLLVKHLPAAEALRRAQLEAARVSGSRDWAAFALYGWPDSSI